MKMNFNDVLYAFSYALDCVEHEILGATTNHGKRVAYISTVMGRSLGISEDELLDLAACAVLHDNALTEYLMTEYNKELFEKADNREIGVHCSIGEANIKNLPFQTNVEEVILYHHENVDGSGPFGKHAADTPLFAQLIHLADVMDVECDLGTYQESEYQEVVTYLRNNQGVLYDKTHVDIFLADFAEENLKEMQGDGIDRLLKEKLPERIIEYAEDTLYGIAAMFAKIIDYKSEFTGTHSIGIAQKAAKMGRFYGYDKETVQKLYMAGAVHDIGKLVISKDVLEKPGKLDNREFAYIQTHAWYTYEILHKIEGFEDITQWASLHHEKLDGTGYPFGKTAAELGTKERLMACVDIYQALTEVRPYKDGLSHETVVGMMRKMAQDGKIDASIVEDLNTCFQPD